MLIKFITVLLILNSVKITGTADYNDGKSVYFLLCKKYVFSDFNFLMKI